MSDPLLLGEPTVIFGVARRYNAKDRRTEIPLNQTSVSLVVTKPDGTTDTFAIGAFRNPEAGRYELDYTPTQEGIYRAKITYGPTAYVDEFGNNRTFTGEAVQTFRVKRFAS